MTVTQTKTGVPTSHRQRASTNKVAETQAQQQNPAQQKRLYSYYNSAVHPVNLKNQAFKLVGLIRSTQKTVNLNPFTIAFDWQDISGQAWLSGSLTLQSTGGNREHLQVGHNDMVRCLVYWGGRWVHLWDQRIWDPDHILQQSGPQLQANIYDDLYLLSLSVDNFHYHDVYCHDILRAIAQRYKIPLGKISMGTYKIKKFDYANISPLTAIVNAYKIEKQHTGRVFVLRWVNGKLQITPRIRNPVLYTMRQQLIDATVHHVTPADFATVLTGRSSVSVADKHSHKLKKNAVTVSSQVDQFGYIHNTETFSKHYDDTQLEKATKRALASRQQVGHSIDFDYSGIAVIRKGDAVEVNIPQEGYGGWRSVVWVSDITHTVNPGNYTMTPTVTSAAPAGMPVVNSSEGNLVKAAQQRAAARKRRKAATTAAGVKGSTNPSSVLGELG